MMRMNWNGVADELFLPRDADAAQSQETRWAYSTKLPSPHGASWQLPVIASDVMCNAYNNDQTTYCQIDSENPLANDNQLNWFVLCTLDSTPAMKYTTTINK